MVNLFFFNFIESSSGKTLFNGLDVQKTKPFHFFVTKIKKGRRIGEIYATK